MLALTTMEVAAFTGLDEKSIRKDVEQGVLDVGSPPRFPEKALVYFLARALFTFSLTAQDRRKLYDLVSDAAERHLRQLELGRGWILDVEALTRDIRDRTTRFEDWKSTRVIESPARLAGEPVFAGSRLSVRHVGDMLRRGADITEVREDYPYLTDEDVEFAPLFATAYPHVGRPRGQTAAR